jgi:HEAT repeat protein
MSFLLKLLGVPDLNRMFEQRDSRGLIKALKYRLSAEVREAAAAALGQLGDHAAVEPLLSMLGKANEKLDVRQAAAWSLGMLHDRRATSPLLALLKSETNPQVRESIMEALGKIKDPAAVDGLIGQWSSPDRMARRAAIDAVASIGKPAEAAVERQLGDPNQRVKLAAEEALRKIRRTPTQKRGKQTDLISPLLAAIKSPRIAADAAKMMSTMGDQRAIVPLLEAELDARQADNVDLAQEIAQATQRLTSKVGIGPLAKALDSSKPRIRALAARHMGKSSNPDAAGPLQEALKDTNERVASIAQRALKELD